MKRKPFTRLLALALILVLALGLLPLTALAGPKPQQYWTDLQGKSDLEQPGTQYLRLVNDVTIAQDWYDHNNDHVHITGTVHLDLNGYTLDVRDLIVEGSLYVYDSSRDQTGSIDKNFGFPEYKDWKLHRYRSCALLFNANQVRGYHTQTTITVADGGTLVVNGGTISGGHSMKTWVVACRNENDMPCTGYIWVQEIATGVEVNSGGSLIVNSGTIRGRSPAGCVLNLHEDARVMLNGGTFQGRGGADVFHGSLDRVKGCISGGTFESKTLDNVLQVVPGTNVLHIKDLPAGDFRTLPQQLLPPEVEVTKESSTRVEVHPRDPMENVPSRVELEVTDAQTYEGLLNANTYYLGSDAGLFASLQSLYPYGRELNEDLRNDTSYSLSYDWYTRTDSGQEKSLDWNEPGFPLMRLNQSDFGPSGMVIGCRVTESLQDGKHSYEVSYSAEDTYTAEPRKALPLVDLTLSKPKAGEKLDCSPEPKTPSPNYEVMGVDWFDWDTNEKLPNGSTCQVGHSYGVRIELGAAEDFYFNKVRINGNSADIEEISEDKRCMTIGQNFLVSEALISRAEATVTVPVANAPCVNEAQIPANVPYKLSKIYWTKEGSPYAMREGSLFEESTNYTAHVVLLPSYGYRFNTVHMGLDTKINGHNADYTALETGGIELTYQFYVKGLPLINKVSARITDPVPGQQPRFVGSTPEDANYYIDEIRWTPLGAPNVNISRFAPRGKYSAYVTLRIKDGYQFAHNDALEYETNLQINGQKAVLDQRIDDYTLVLRRDFEPLETPIPQNLTWSGRLIYWDPVPGAEQYELQVQSDQPGAEPIKQITKERMVDLLSLLQDAPTAGVYTASVGALFPGENYAYQLSQPVSQTFYPVQVKNGNAAFGTMLTTTAAPAEEPLYISADPAPQNQMFTGWELGADSTPVELENASSSPSSFVMPAGPVSLEASYAVPVPIRLTWDQTTAYWNQMTDAAGYQVQIYCSGKLVATKQTDQCEMNIPEALAPDLAQAGDYTFRVGPIYVGESEPAAYSKMSDALTFYAIHIENGTAALSDGIRVEAAPRGEFVSIAAEEDPKGSAFQNWSNASATAFPVEFEDQNVRVTRFRMPEGDVHIQVVYEALGYLVLAGESLPSVTIDVEAPSGYLLMAGYDDAGRMTHVEIRSVKGGGKEEFHDERFRHASLWSAYLMDEAHLPIGRNATCRNVPVS